MTVTGLAFEPDKPAAVKFSVSKCSLNHLTTAGLGKYSKVRREQFATTTL